MHFEALGQLALRQAKRNPERHERSAKAVKVLQLPEIASPQALVALDLLFQLKVEGPQWIESPLELLRL